MKSIFKDNVHGAEVCQQRKPYCAPCIEIVATECGVSILAESGPQPEVEEGWADDDCGML